MVQLSAKFFFNIIENTNAFVWDNLYGVWPTLDVASSLSGDSWWPAPFVWPVEPFADLGSSMMMMMINDARITMHNGQQEKVIPKAFVIVCIA